MKWQIMKSIEQSQVSGKKWNFFDWSVLWFKLEPNVEDWNLAETEGCKVANTFLYRARIRPTLFLEEWKVTMPQAPALEAIKWKRLFVRFTCFSRNVYRSVGTVSS